MHCKPRNFPLVPTAVLLAFLAAGPGNTPALAKSDPAGLTAAAAGAGGSESDSKVVAAVKEQAKAYEDAFRGGDAGALAALWAENGTYSDSDGNTYNGRAEIEKLFQSYFQQADAAKNIEIEISSVRTIGDKAAIEKGVAKIKDGSGKLLSEAPYTVVHLNDDGKWQMASVTEQRGRFYNNLLEDLSWLSGEWSAKGPGGEANLSSRWMADKRFLIARFQVKTTSGEQREDLQIIGVDPGRKAIVSWIFDSEGGYGRGVWSNDGKKWAVDMTRTAPGGMRMQARNYLERKDNDTFTWHSTDRQVEGLLVPDSDTITVNRIHL